MALDHDHSALRLITGNTRYTTIVKFANGSRDCAVLAALRSQLSRVRATIAQTNLGANATVVLRKDQTHQLFNVGETPLEILGVFGTTPVPTAPADGVVLELPWTS